MGGVVSKGSSSDGRAGHSPENLLIADRSLGCSNLGLLIQPVVMSSVTRQLSEAVKPHLTAEIRTH